MMGTLTDNWQLKLMSLGFALVLWFFVMGERRVEVGYQIPLELLNVPEGMVVTSETPNVVEVRLSGPRALLSSLDDKNVRISLDLSGLKSGGSTVRRLEDHLRLPFGVRVTRIAPATLEVRLERIIERDVPVRLLLSGKPAPGYRLAAVELNPERILVRGAEHEVLRLREVVSERIRLDDLNASRELVVPLSYQGRFTRLKDTDVVRAYLQIDPVSRAVPMKKD